MREISFTMPIKPQGKARPRFTRTGHAYTPKNTRDYEQTVELYARRTMDGETPFECALRVTIEAVFEPPRSWGKTKRAGFIVFGYPHDKKPDCDNIAKAVLDALNGIVFLDDKQVTELIVRKRYGESDAVSVTIEAI